MSTDAVIAYDELLREAEAVIRKCLDQFAAEPDPFRKAMFRDFANGALLMWTGAAFTAAVRAGDAATAAYRVDETRLEALIDSVAQH